jgi:tetraacyldisaccharide 4'-kinase
MQSKGDASRLVSLGAAKERVLTTGNLKYDLAVPGESPLSAWLEAELARHGRRPVVVAGSVLANEEGPVLQAFGCVEREFPRALLILAPRKPEQFDNAAAIVVQSGRKLLRRRDLVLNGAGNADFSKPGGVLLLDSIGELAGLYRLADTVFVGGSLVPAGGHNILEPAVFGKAPVYGSSMENFREMAEQFLASGAGVRVKNSDELGNAWTSLLRDPERASRMGGSARQLVDQNRGATQRVLEHIERVIGCRGSREVNRPSGWLRLLWPLSVLYSLAARGKAWCYDRGLFPVRRLPGKVISVGNLTVGGTGKTPMVLAIAERLAREGKQAAILTRGYKGTPDGQPGGVPQSDEVALLRERVAGKVKLGVGPDRYANGMTLSRHGIDCFILDDGFQHLRLARDANIALIDATDPFGGRMVLPAGRLREPVSALGRADLVVITRSVQASSPALEAVLRRHTNSPIFYASTHLENVLRVPRLDIPLPQQDWRKARFLAFCGIGNPAAFFNDLRQWGFQLVRERSFADHHAYTAEEAVELEKAASASSADALLCTEKDVWNLRNVQFRSLPVYCCRISFELPETFWAALSETVRRSGPGDEPR